MRYRLLDTFQGLFEGKRYEHRNSTLGDLVASFLFEDLLAVNRSEKFSQRVMTQRLCVSAANKAIGRGSRRGDGTMGEIVPGQQPIIVEGYAIPRGPIASIAIGVETKILAKAMIKQIDRVATDLRNQAEQFKRSNPRAIAVAVVGINAAPHYVSYEGDRSYSTDGKKAKHPAQECDEALRRLDAHAQDAFDEFIVLRFSATNTPPHSFAWVDEALTRSLYGAALVRIANAYDARA